MKKEDWKKELLELCFELKNRTYGSHYRVLSKFIRQLLEEEKKKWVKENTFPNRGFCKCQKNKPYEERVDAPLNNQWLCKKCVLKQL